MDIEIDHIYANIGLNKSSENKWNIFSATFVIVIIFWLNECHKFGKECRCIQSITGYPYGWILCTSFVDLGDHWLLCAPCVCGGIRLGLYGCNGRRYSYNIGALRIHSTASLSLNFDRDMLLTLTVIVNFSDSFTNILINDY